MRTLDGLVVLEWGDHVSAPYASRLLAELGADVVKVESPRGDGARALPTPNGKDAARGALFEALNFDKRGIVLDLDDPGDRALMEDLIGGADVFLSNRPFAERRRHRLDGESLLSRHPALVAAAVTPFGDSGPLRDLPGCSLTASALAAASWSAGTPGRPPLTMRCDLPDYVAGANAAAAALAAHRVRVRDGVGQVVDVAVSDVIASFVSINARIYVDFGKPWRREGRRASGSGGPYPYGLFPCRDGYVVIIGRSARDWRAIVAAAGDPAWAGAPGFDDPFVIAREHADEADSLLADWLTRHSRAELVGIARQHGFALAPVNSVADALGEPQFALRRSFVDGLSLDGMAITPPRAPFRLAGETPPRAVRPAPRLDEHRAEIVAELATRRPGRDRRDTAPEDGPARPPLAGLRVLDLSWVWSGPMVAYTLGDLGAEVIKVEHRDRLDNSRLRGRPIRDGVPVEGPVEEISPYFHQNNHGKLSVTLNMKHPGGAELIRRLAATADVIVENLRPGVLRRAGLSYEGLSAVNPRLVMLSMSSAGQDGPLSDIRAYAPVMTSFSGYEALLGYDDDPCVGMMSFGIGDPNAASHALIALLAAIAARERTGRGHHIDLSQIECMLSTLAEPVVGYQVDGALPGPASTDHAGFSPHGHFPCAGDDRWIAIAVADDDEWHRLAAILDPDGAAGLVAGYATAAERRAARTELSDALAALTRGRERNDLFLALLGAGVRAAPVLSLEEMQAHEQFAARGLFASCVHACTGEETLVNVPWRLSRTPPRIKASSPLVGEHTDDVLTRVLGLSAEEIDEHERAGALR